LTTADERAAERAKLPKLLTAEFLDRLTTAVIAYDGDEQAHVEAISFVLWCYEIAGREPPDLGRFCM
jgi:hypothetical protein